MSTALNVAHIVPYSVTFPLKNHNGRYQWMIDLVNRQAAGGMQVYVYSNSSSLLDIPGVTWRSTPGIFADAQEANRSIIRQAFSDNAVDLYHSHFDNLHYEFASETDKPVVFTQHWWPTTETVAIASSYKETNVWAVPPTHFMYKFDMKNNIRSDGFVHHGIDLQRFKPSGEKKSSRLLFVGRISPEKNIDLAIAAAKKAGLGLDIVGKVMPKNLAYWNDLQALVDGDQIRYIGALPTDELISYYSRAAALIFPSDIHEAFGLVAIESQACGTPVLMYDGGSRRELTSDSVSGFLCSSVDDFAFAAKQASKLSAQDCVTFAAKFDVNNMTASYTRLYEKLVSQAS